MAPTTEPTLTLNTFAPEERFTFVKICSPASLQSPSALKSIQAKTLIVGIDTDFLFPVIEQKFIAENIPGAEYVELTSLYGHDGFLVEFEQLDSIIKQFYQQKQLRAALV